MIDSRPVCDYEGSNYQADFWDKGERDYEDRAERIALAAFLPRSGRAALELGAGAGRLTPLLAGFGHVVLLDYSRTQIQQARARLGGSPRYTYVAANVYQLPFAPGVFDGATLIRVIHHLADAPSALREIRSVMAPGGAFILEFANKRNWKAILRFWLRRQSWSPFSPEPVEFVKLNFDFHPAAMRRWLAAAGFSVRHQRTVSHYRLAWLKRLAPAGALAAADSLVQPTGDWLQFSPSVFVQCSVAGPPPAVPPGPFDARASLRCPICKGALLAEGAPNAGAANAGAADAGDGVLACSAAHRWGRRDGIYDFKEQLA